MNLWSYHGKGFVQQITKFNFVICQTKYFSESLFLKVLKAFQMFRGYFQCFWENKVKQSKLYPLFSKQRQSEIPTCIVSVVRRPLRCLSSKSLTPLLNWFRVGDRDRIADRAQKKTTIKSEWSARDKNLKIFMCNGNLELIVTWGNYFEHLET